MTRRRHARYIFSICATNDKQLEKSVPEIDEATNGGCPIAHGTPAKARISQLAAIGGRGH